MKIALNPQTRIHKGLLWMPVMSNTKRSIAAFCMFSSSVFYLLMKKSSFSLQLSVWPGFLWLSCLGRGLAGQDPPRHAQTQSYFKPLWLLLIWVQARTKQTVHPHNKCLFPQLLLSEQITKRSVCVCACLGTGLWIQYVCLYIIHCTGQL